MRCNQVPITIERFGKYVPENYPADVQRIHVYCDDSLNIYAALSKAYALAINELAEYEQIGARTDVYTNEFSREDYREMHGALLETKRKYEEDVNFQYIDTDIQLCEDRIWVYENAEKILEVLKKCEDNDGVKAALKDKFQLNDYQIRKLSQMRFDMLTKQEYLETKRKQKMRKAGQSTKIQEGQYRREKLRKLQVEIEKLKAYFVFVEHYKEIVELSMEMESSAELERKLQEKLGVSREYVQMFRYFNLNEFSKEEQQKKREQMERLERDLSGVIL